VDNQTAHIQRDTSTDSKGRLKLRRASQQVLTRFNQIENKLRMVIGRWPGADDENEGDDEYNEDDAANHDEQDHPPPRDRTLGHSTATVCRVASTTDNAVCRLYTDKTPSRPRASTPY